MAMKRTKHQQEMLDGKHGNDDGLFQTPPADSALPAGIDRRSLMQNAAIGAAAVMTGAALTPEARAQAAKEHKDRVDRHRPGERKGRRRSDGEPPTDGVGVQPCRQRGRHRPSARRRHPGQKHHWQGRGLSHGERAPPPAPSACTTSARSQITALQPSSARKSTLSTSAEPLPVKSPPWTAWTRTRSRPSRPATGWKSTRRR